MYKKQAILSAGALLCFGLTLISCNNKDENPIVGSPTTRYTASLNGANQRPTSTTSTATGTFTGDVNTTTRVMSYTLTLSGLTPIAAHLHRITAADSTGPVMVPFSSTITNGYSGTVTLAQTQLDSMNNNQVYANVHSAAYPAGEIRGNVRRQ